MRILFGLCMILMLSEISRASPDKWLKPHNVERATKNLKALKWDVRLVKEAEKWVSHLAKTCTMYHSSNGYGENLWMSLGSNQPPAIKRTVDAWISEKKWYDYKRNKSTDPKKPVGHYTQVMWSTTKYLGCAEKRCIFKTKEGKDQVRFIRSCNYDPPGNFRGRRPY